MDEPFAGLDPQTRGALLYDAATALRSALTATVVVVHDRAESWALASRLLALIDGMIAAEGAPREPLAHPPTPEVARFLGFDGELRDGRDLLLTRTSYAQLDGEGPLHATVVGTTPLEDGARVELDLPNGHLSMLSDIPGPAIGDQVRLRLTGGVRYTVG